MLCSPGEPTKVQFNDQFLKMKNLRLLIICNIKSCGCLEYLPNGLKLLDWQGFPWSSLSPKFYPKKLVSLNLSHSRIEKPFKQVCYLVFINYYLYKLYFNFFFFLSSTDLFVLNLDKSEFQFL
jgi:hypothetical protein